MKPHLLILPIVAGIITYQASAQQQQTSDQLVIDTAVDYIESNTDRTVYDITRVIIIDHADASYTGTDVNITCMNPSSSGDTCGIFLDSGTYINLTTSGKDIWNTINVTSDGNTNGIVILAGASQTSHISNTQINVTAGYFSQGINNYSSQTVELDNVNIDINYPGGGAGLRMQGGGTITNKGKGQVSMTGVGLLIQNGGSTFDLYNATITLIDDPQYGALGFIVSTPENNLISLTDSTITSINGSALVTAYTVTSDGVTNTVNLDNVNLDNAKNQLIGYSSTLVVNLSNGTNFDGYADGTGSLTLDIASGASWHVTQDSTTGLTGSLSLGAESTISFVSTESADFTNINSAAVMLAEGSILKLDKNADAFNEGDIITLFTGASGDTFTNDGAILITADGQQLDYLDLDNGTFQILKLVIPEPTTSTLGLVALSLLTLRCRARRTGKM